MKFLLLIPLLSGCALIYQPSDIQEATENGCVLKKIESDKKRKKSVIECYEPSYRIDTN